MRQNYWNASVSRDRVSSESNRLVGAINGGILAF